MKNDLVIIAGGSGKLGVSLVNKYIAEGFTVLIISRNKVNLSNKNILSLQHDLIKPLSSETIEEIVPNFKERLKIVIHCIGGYLDKVEIDKLNEFYFGRFVLSLFFLQFELRDIIKDNNGIFLYFSSRIIDNLNIKNFSYCSSKLQGEYLMKVISKEYANTQAQSIIVRLKQFNYLDDLEKSNLLTNAISKEIFTLSNSKCNNGCIVII